MRRIFISYRRADSADAAGRLYDRLAEQFGGHNVFMDVDDIRPGEDYVVAIERRIANCDTMIVLLGPGWGSATNEAGARRLDDPHDLARLEVEAALRRNVRVIPILLGDAEMPAAKELPEALQPLLRRQAVRLSHASFHKDVDLLLERLGRRVKHRAPRRWPWLVAGGAVAIAIVVAILLVAQARNGGGESGDEVRPNPGGEVDQARVRDPKAESLKTRQAEPEPPPARDPGPTTAGAALDHHRPHRLRRRSLRLPADPPARPSAAAGSPSPPTRSRSAGSPKARTPTSSPAPSSARRWETAPPAAPAPSRWKTARPTTSSGRTSPSGSAA